jgi:hypothetical protein
MICLAGWLAVGLGRFRLDLEPVLDSWRRMRGRGRERENWIDVGRIDTAEISSPSGLSCV